MVVPPVVDTERAARDGEFKILEIRVRDIAPRAVIRARRLIFKAQDRWSSSSTCSNGISADLLPPLVVF